MPNKAQQQDSKTTTHAVLVQVTLIIEVNVEASSKEEAARVAKGFELDANILTGRMTGLPGRQWVEFDQTTALRR